MQPAAGRVRRSQHELCTAARRRAGQVAFVPNRQSLGEPAGCPEIAAHQSRWSQYLHRTPHHADDTESRLPKASDSEANLTRRSCARHQSNADQFGQKHLATREFSRTQGLSQSASAVRMRDHHDLSRSGIDRPHAYGSDASQEGVLEVLAGTDKAFSCGQLELQCAAATTRVTRGSGCAPGSGASGNN